ncbi:hypothetical protein EUTSA_v10028096mg [Eutrema salsugineum]|uniref:RING-CH-type domain-containing protein n=1 Tax=Eutrema salsugineum TaxID=72664 RepID=V4LA04_EUTSA|nr:hypothetical protein EUTSA_v10028096mg [Eutrema salsugineum]
MGDHLVLVVNQPKADSVNEDGAFESVIAGTDICESQFVKCRIFHDEDENFNMDTPCSCSGTLKFAHHSCVQRWCNEKGDTVCEICRQRMISSFIRFIAPQSLIFCRVIALLFILLFLRHSLPVFLGKIDYFSLTLLMLPLLKTLGILLLETF